jgi:hypothetical protein
MTSIAESYPRLERGKRVIGRLLQGVRHQGFARARRFIVKAQLKAPFANKTVGPFCLSVLFSARALTVLQLYFALQLQLLNPLGWG